MADQQQHEQKKPGFVASQNASCLVNTLKVTNFLNSAFLIFASVWWYLLTAAKTCPEDEDTGPGCFSLNQALCAIYICFFSLLLLFFEFHCKKFDASIFALFGFMFSWYGRLFFLFFTGTLAFTLEDVGIGAGSYTIANIIFNYYCLAHNAGYKAHVKSLGRAAHFAAKETHFQSKGLEMQAGVGGGSGGASAGAGDSSGFPGANESGNPTGPDWERFHDAESGAYYFYNHKTKVTQWEGASV